MSPPPKPDNEEARLDALYSFDILDSAPEQGFDDLVRIAAGICGVPMAAVTLIDRDRQWFKAQVGIEHPDPSRESSFCAHAILAPERTMVVPDATRDTRFADNPLVTAENDIRFYAGAPLLTRKEFVVLLPGATLEEARLQCEFMRQSVGLLPIGLPVSVSIGVATHRRGDAAEDLFRRADQALYEAKRGGRDRVVAAD